MARNDVEVAVPRKPEHADHGERVQRRVDGVARRTPVMTRLKDTFERKRERQRQRQRERQRERETETERHRDRERQRDIERHRQRTFEHTQRSETGAKY